ncbi:MAG: hypothetical protein RL748_2481, partial [Pseudomonadota bacterium]
LHELNATASAPLNVTCVHDWFEREAASHPDAIALVFGEQQLTYHELNLQANRLAHYLLDQRALQAESLVGICLDRSLQMVVALLAVVKAGGAYVPLDPNYPAARLAYMVSDASLHTILTTAALWQPLSDQLPVPAGQVLCLDLPDLQQGLASQSGDNIDLQRVGLSSQSLVYLIYTSGSTGNPKGVMIEHGGLCNTIADNSEQFLVDRQSVFLQSISLNFDAASWVIWMTLSRGGELVIADDAVRMGQGADVAINEGEITHIMMTPSSLALLDPASVHGLRSVIVGGEACSPALAAKWLPHVCFFNAYGPTEASICTNVSKVQQADLITIGKPVRNMAMYVVDRHLQLTPPGVAGELLIGGAGLARGYLHRPELDAEKFIPNPFHDAQPSGTEVPHCPRLYRSGDWVRWLADGSLAFSGRIDDQVKIRGFRIELGEIENALRHLPFIKDAAVLAKPTGHGDQQLVAYLVVRSASEAEQINSGPELIARARQALAASLPEYMVPAVLLILSVLPLTPNGKVDRKALPEPDFSLLRGSFIAPVTPIEQTLCQLYQEILGVSQVGLEDNFFLLGGHSLSATRLLAGISQQLHLDVPLKTLFHAQTVAELAGILQHMAPALDWPPLVAVPRNQALPLSYAQQRLWLLDRIDGGSALYNIPGSLALHGKLDQEAMNYAFAKIVARHESLRTCFSADDDGTPLQIIMPARPFAISEVDLSALSPQQQAVRVPQLVAEEALRIFDLRKDLMLRASLLKLGEQDYLLLVSMHHIAADGWSMAVLFREFSMLYAAHLAGQRDPLPALALQYADYACWQRNWLQGERLQRQLDYWRTQLADLPLVHGLPLDFPRPKRQTFGGQTVRSEIDADTSKRLLALCQQHGATLFMGLHAVFSALLARYSNENDIVIGSPIANREQAQVADLIGFFVNILVLRSDVSGDPDFVTLLERSKRTLFDAYAHQQVPFEQVVERLQPERSLSHSPLFQIMLVLQNNQQAELELPGLSMGALLQTGNIAKYDLALTATESDSGLKLEWEFNTGLFEAATIVRMARHFEALLLACLDRVHAGVMLHNMLGADELQQQMLDWNRTAGDFPATQCLHQLFEAQVLKDPFAIAVSHKLEHISFAELNARANRLARYLRSTRTIAPDSLIGICVERSVNMVVGILAILKAGAAYVPLDPDYPATRLAYMLTEARLDTVLTQSSLLARLNLHGADSVVLDDPLLQEKLALQADSNLPPGEIGLHSRHLAYVIYTSGSTGNPKGVMIEHRSLVNLVCCDRDLFDLNGRSRLLNPLSIGFDAGNGYVWDALCNGAHLVLHAADESLFTLIAAQQITHAVMPAALLQVQKITPCDSLQVLISGGDACNPEVLSKFGPATRFFNVYGPTENTVTSTCQQILPGQTVGIGRPLANMVAYVLSPQMVLLPRGCVGQLHVGGIGLARGYLHRPDLTDEKFVSNPFFGQSQVDSSPLLYKTGDLVRWLPDGNLEFLGRIDHQVKIRGFRIELGDIESALLAQASVKEAVVQAQIFANGEKRLVAYVVPEGEGPALATAPDQAAQQDLIDAILQKLSQAVPEYMVPSVVMLLPAMPLTPNGKIDKKALPASTVLPRQALVAPRNQIEQRLCTIWCDLLGLEQVGVHENFFESGGNSLLAIKAQGLISEQFGLNLTVADLFAWPTISSLASFLHAQQQEEVDDEDDAEKTPQRSPHDSASQARATDIAIIGMAGRFPGAADIDAFWQNISAGVESIRTFTEEELLAAGVDPALMQHPDYVRTGTLLEERDMFDAGYFGFTPREAEITCPQQRLLLEVSVQTLEHAGYGQQPAGQRVGVFVGATSSLYLFKHLMPNAELRHSMGMGGLMLAADKDFIASRIAYKLNLTGPAVSLNTACSTSLVAISQACMNLVQNQCDMALAGAATLQLLSTEGYLYQDGGIYSPDGHCYPFDQRARGTRAGSGAGMVLLKRLDRALADGDTIHGVILGVGINNDGKFKVGYTAPSVQGQAGAIRDALRMAAVAPSSIRYIETHGTATSIGDPIEVAALMKAYKPRAAALPHGDLVALGALKANIGHLDTAAGIAGLIKTLQALKAHKFPANINFSQANQQIDFANSPFYVNTVMKDWPAAAEPRRAAVSSFGIGGTNAHLIVQEAPAQSPGESHRHSHLLLLSAKTRSSLLLAAAQLRQWLAHQLLSGASGA